MESATEFWQEFYDSMTSTQLSWANSLFRLFISLLLGLAVGSERKRKGQAAGGRTFALISMGACLAMLLSVYVPQEYMGLKNGDPSRIAAQVITGIGFLGGGAMIQLKGSVRGLTTAAGIWMTAIVGMAIGVGMYIAGLAATLLCLLVLSGLDWYEHRRRFGQESKVINVKVDKIVSDISSYKQTLEEQGIHLSTFYVEYNYERSITIINFIILSHPGNDLLKVIQSLRSLAPTHSITLSNQIQT